jgi:Flp pilus assembly pilin Flp
MDARAEDARGSKVGRGFPLSVGWAMSSGCRSTVAVKPERDRHRLPTKERPRMYELLMRPVVALQVAVHELKEREDGQTTTEYAILLGFLAIAIIIALFFLRNVLRGLFSSAASSVSNAPN